MSKLTPLPEAYDGWLQTLKANIRQAQLSARLAINREPILLYWRIGRDILERQQTQGWGAKVIDRLAADLRSAFPEMRAFAEAWPEELLEETAQQSEIDRLDRHIAQLGRGARHPGPVIGTVLRVVRLGERGTVPEIIDILGRASAEVQNTMAGGASWHMTITDTGRRCDRRDNAKAPKLRSLVASGVQSVPATRCFRGIRQSQMDCKP